jgi:hypothetical protein
MKIELQFPLPPTLNQQIHTARANTWGSSKQKEKWLKIVANKCVGQPSFKKKQFYIHCTWFLSNIMNRDPDNVDAARKHLFDGLVACGLISGDSFADFPDLVSLPTNSYHRGNDEVLVTISDKPIARLVFLDEDEFANDEMPEEVA